MGVYINMEMPEFGEKIIILTSSGYVEDVSGQVINGVEAVPVPAHGRLIDADALISRCKDEKGRYYGHESAIIGEAVESAPTVIEAED